MEAPDAPLLTSGVTVLISPRDLAKQIGLIVLLMVSASGIGLLVGSVQHPVPLWEVLAILGGVFLFVLLLGLVGNYRLVEVGPDRITAVRAFSTTTIPASSVIEAGLTYVPAGVGPPRPVFLIRGEGKARIVLSRQALRDPTHRAALQRFLAASPLGAPEIDGPEHHVSAAKAPRWRRTLGWTAAATTALFFLVTLLRVTDVLKPADQHRASTAPVAGTGASGSSNTGGTRTGPAPGLPASLVLTGWQVSAPDEERLSRVQLEPGGETAWRRDGFEDCEVIAAAPPGGSGSRAPVVVISLVRFASTNGAAKALALTLAGLGRPAGT
ncbi:hypothetical protein [Aciditerrimonas ferrireducens]|uniref:hypothetical protein n=1 Tax=Aciditerrimonas ferrireducens TaxID=667306 RepID=UPI002005A96D|nr:hypothetical protein [Aciditerrimonas ferrireducens]MCK4176600.1 hypothetical protein [Aciditerrimonas ferrireducens]